MAQTGKATETSADYFTLTIPGDLFEPLHTASKNLKIPKTQLLRMLLRQYFPHLVKKLEG